jgi:hypothetical protein
MAYRRSRVRAPLAPWSEKAPQPRGFLGFGGLVGVVVGRVAGELGYVKARLAESDDHGQAFVYRLSHVSRFAMRAKRRGRIGRRT